MSRIRFEWNIESQNIDRFDGEDSNMKLKRRRNILRILLILALLIAALGLGALAVRQRIMDVQNQFAQLLQDTVKAEVAALRIGDLSAWLRLQSAESEDWTAQQREEFWNYETLKTEGAIEFTGSIVAVDIDDTRARVLVQEDIRELPFVRLWFYQRAEDGWLHVSPDFSFWGEERQVTADGVQVNYRSVDEHFAQQVSSVVTNWRARSCELLNCSALPLIILDVTPAAEDDAAWADEEAAHLILRSPYVDVARADTPFDGSYRLQVGKLLAKRFVAAHSGLRSAAYPHDAIFLFEQSVNWLSGWIVGVQPAEGLISSLAQSYGAEQVAKLFSVLGPEDTMSSLQQVVPEALYDADLDWRDFIAWRLRTEAELIAARSEEEWLSLYDTSDESVRIKAYERFNRNAPPRLRGVIDQLTWTAEEGTQQLRVTAEFDVDEATREEIILFNLVNQVWRRAS